MRAICRSKGESMNRWMKLLWFVLGALCLVCTFMFIFNLRILEELIRENNFPLLGAAVIVVLSSGVGIELGARIILKNDPVHLLINLALGFSVYLFLVQSLLTILPNMSKCKCSTLSENIMSIPDWSLMQYSLLFFIDCLIMRFILNHYGALSRSEIKENQNI